MRQAVCRGGGGVLNDSLARKTLLIHLIQTKERTVMKKHKHLLKVTL